jgi:glucokinase
MSKEIQVLGIDIGATHTSFGVVSSRGKIILNEVMERKSGTKPLIDRLLETSEKIIEAAKGQGKMPSGIAIGSPGIVDSKNGVVVAAGNLPELFGARLGDLFHSKFHLPVFVENDVNALALGEMVFGVAKGQKNFVVFALGTDLGGGIVIDGKLHRGANFIAAEFGHLTLDLAGKQCVCGGYGCAREWVSGEGLAERSREVLPEDSLALSLAGHKREELKAMHVFAAWQKGDSAAGEIIEEFGRRFGALVSNVMKVLDPEVVILAGEVCRQEPEIMNLVVKWTRHYYFSIPRLPEFCLSRFTKEDAVLGPVAAFMVEHGIYTKK